MNPLLVKGRNFGPYASFEWEPADGLTAILGQNRIGEGVSSNGAGKSTLLEAIRVALFGPDLSWSDYLTLGADPDNDLCVVELEFEHGGERYRVRRSFSAKGRGKSATDFDRAEDGPHEGVLTPGWRTLSRDRQDETQALIERTLGLSETTFRHSVFASQGAQHFADPNLPPRERKAILADALGLDVWARLLEAVRTDMSEARKELVRIDAILGTVAGDLDERAGWEEHRRSLAVRLGGERKQAEEAHEGAEAARRRRDDAKAQTERWTALTGRHRAAQAALDALHGEVQTAKEAAVEVGRISEVVAELEKGAAKVPELEAEIARMRAASDARDGALAQIAALTQQRSELERQAGARRIEGERIAEAARAAFEAARAVELGETKTCGHCGQPLADEAREKAAKSSFDEGMLLERQASDRVTEVLELEQRAQAVRAQAAQVEMPPDVDLQWLEALERQVAVARRAAEEAQAMREQRAGLAQRVAQADSAEFRSRVDDAFAERQAAQEALAAAEPPADLDTLEHEATAATSAESDANQQVRTTELELARADEKLRHLDALVERVEAASRERRQTEDRLMLMETLERAYGANGIPALILENSAIPQVEAEAQRVLEALGMPFRLELVTQKETKSSTVKDTLDVVVHEPNGPRRYETYSGGEQTRLELALRIALARLIAQRRGADVGLLALDEPSWLDAAGQMQLVEVLRGLTEFRAIVLVSHDESLVDAFDHHVTVVRDETGSRLEEVA